MRVREIVKDVFQISYDYKGGLFEGMWRLDNGVAVNSYIIKGEQIILIDGMFGGMTIPAEFVDAINKIGIGLEDINGIIINHLEPDHTGWLDDFRQVNNDFIVYCTQKAKDLFEKFYEYDYPLNFTVVKTGDEFDAGKSFKFVFHEIPFVHWPETMMTYLEDQKILFTCDLFGSYHTLDNVVYDDDEISLDDEEWKFETAEYFATVLNSFAPHVQKALQKVKSLEPELIMPGHGRIIRDVDEGIELYEFLSKQHNKPKEKFVTLVYGSMYGMTDQARSAVEEILLRLNVEYKYIRVPNESMSEVLGSILLSDAVIMGMPTYEYRMFPPMFEVLQECERKKITNRKLFRFGSYGWSGGAQRELEEYLKNSSLNWELLDSYEFRGALNEKEKEELQKKVSAFIKGLK